MWKCFKQTFFTIGFISSSCVVIASFITLVVCFAHLDDGRLYLGAKGDRLFGPTLQAGITRHIIIYVL